MKLKIVLASIVSLAVVAPSVGFAEERPHIKWSRDNASGIIRIDPTDAAAADTCLKQGGTVRTQGGKTICSIPATQGRVTLEADLNE